MNSIEALAALLVVVNVALVARRSIVNYPVAIVAVAIYAGIFADARLYSDMVLQGFFLVVNVYGWIDWARVKGQAGEVVVGTLAVRTRTLWVVGIAGAAAAWPCRRRSSGRRRPRRRRRRSRQAGSR